MKLKPQNFLRTVLLVAEISFISAEVLDLPIHVANTYSSVEIQIGTPPKPYRLLFDTGSASSWVVDKICVDDAETCPNRSQYKRVGYNASDSSTSEFLGPYSFIEYFGGGVGGDATRDTFAVSTPPGTFSWPQTFLDVRMSSWQWITADGFLGLAFDSISETNATTLVETLMRQGSLTENRFGIYYGTNLSDTDNNPDGILTIGGSKEDVYVDGGMTYIALKNEYPYQVWRAPLRSITTTSQTAGNQTFSARRVRGVANPYTQTFPTGNNGRVVFDTGAGRISLPSEVISDVYQALGWNHSKLLTGEQRWSCNDFNETWSISFTFGENDPEQDQTLTIAGDEFLTSWDPQCQPPFDNSETEGFGLFGISFLRRFYSVWDFGGDSILNFKPRVGFGKLKKEYDYLRL